MAKSVDSQVERKLPGEPAPRDEVVRQCESWRWSNVKEGPEKPRYVTPLSHDQLSDVLGKALQASDFFTARHQR